MHLLRRRRFSLLLLNALPGMFADPAAAGGTGDTPAAGDKPGAKPAGDKPAAQPAPGAGATGDTTQPPGDGQPVPYVRFTDVVRERNEAQRTLGERDAEVTRLTAQVQQLQSDDQGGTVTQLQAEVGGLKKQVQEIDDYFSGLLEAEYGNLPADAAAMVKDVPGGPRKQFEYLTKHRARLAGAAAPAGDVKPPGKHGAAHDRRPGAAAAGAASGEATRYADRHKPATEPAKSGWRAKL
jgi:hypothetical protein